MDSRIFTYSGVKYTAMFRNCDTTGWLAVATLPLSEVNHTRNYLIETMALVSILMLAPAGPADCICGPQGAEAFGRYQRQYGGIFRGIWMWIYGLSGMMRLEDCLKASVPQCAP